MGLNINNIERIQNVEIDLENANTIVQPNWLSVSNFEANVALTDKVSRVANLLISGTALYGLYALMTGVNGLLAYTSYLSMGLVARKIASTIIGYLVYPAAIKSLSTQTRDYFAKYCTKEMQRLETENFITKKISLNVSGIQYDAILISHKDTIENGNWTINALGNNMAMEFLISRKAKENFNNNSNTLLVNGPSVGQSGGWPTRYQFGAGFEAGLQFLEREVKAHHIIMEGLSLGGGMMGEAIINHDFTEGIEKGINYLSITDRSFSRLSTIAGALVSRIVEPMFHITGTELDGVAAAQKLSQLGIQHIVIQHKSADENGDDGVITDKASLAYELHKDSSLKNKVFLESELIDHNGSLPENIERNLKYLIREFLG